MVSALLLQNLWLYFETTQANPFIVGYKLVKPQYSITFEILMILI